MDTALDVKPDKTEALSIDQLNIEEPMKICVVCGDKALGHNFNAITCESCKAFFRRNALKKKVFKCRFSDNCQITIASRRYCQKCRLKKCFQMGMLSELITVQPPDEDNCQETFWTAPRLKRQHSQEINVYEPSNKLIKPNNRFFGLTNTSLPVVPSEPYYNTLLPHYYSTFLYTSEHSETPSPTIDPNRSPNYIQPNPQIRPLTVLHHTRTPAATLDHLDYNLPSVPNHQLSIDNVDNQHDKQCNTQSTTPIESDTNQSIINRSIIDRSIIDRSRIENDHQSMSTTENDTDSDPMISLPKSVLLHLINLCHRGSRDASTSEASTSRNDTPISMTCICPCVCNSKEDVKEKSINQAEDITIIQSSDQLDGTIDRSIQSINEEQSTIVILDTYTRHRPTVNWTDEVFKHAGDGIIRATTETVPNQEIMDLVPRETSYIEFPTDMDAWKLFRLEELLSANEILAHAREQSGPIISYMDSGMAADMMDLAIRRALDMAKHVSAFNAFMPSDQIALFQGAIRELMCLRGLMVYEPSVMCFRPVGYPYRYLRIDAMTDDGNPRLKRFYDSFHDNWRRDDPIMLCLSSLTLFDPSRANVRDVNAVRTQRSFYKELLRSYLRTLYGPLEADEVMKKLFQRLFYMKENLALFSPNIQVEMNPRTIEPLLIDILP